jgi:hypothetical protein
MIMPGPDRDPGMEPETEDPDLERGIDPNREPPDPRVEEPSIEPGKPGTKPGVEPER